MNSVSNITTRSGRKLLFHSNQALRAKNRVYGKYLPPNRLLMKLREPGKSPTWVRLARDVFDREKYFRAVHARL